MKKRWLLSVLWLLCCWAGGKAQAYRQLTDLPALFIETEGGAPILTKDSYVRCRLVLVDSARTVVYKRVGIRGRGNSTWRMSDKKPYRLHFDRKVRLLGKTFAAAKNWTLLANHGDKTLMRNALTYELGKCVGLPFCPAARFVDVYLNGEYRGTYQISDQVEAGKGRVDIDKRTGWLLETTSRWGRESQRFTTSRGFEYNIMNPSRDRLTPRRRKNIERAVERMEAAVFSPDFAAPGGYRAFLDEATLVDWYVAAEISGNIDALLSIYLYRRKGKWHFGPLWDMDFAYDRSGERSLLYELSAFLDMEDRPYQQVMQRLWQDPRFAAACHARLRELVGQGLQQRLLGCIDSLSRVLHRSQQENFRRWPIDAPVYSWEKPVYHATYAAYVDDLKRFVRLRIPYLAEKFADLEEKSRAAVKKTTAE